MDGSSFEDELGQALRRTGDAFQADSHALVSAGVARGRRIRRRRRAGIAGGVTALALVGVGGAVVPGLMSSGSPASAPTAVASSVQAAASTPSRPAGRSVSDKEMVRLLRGLLPKGKVSETSGRGVSSDQKTPLGASAQAVFDDGQGAAQVAVLLNRQPTPVSDDDVSCPDKAHNPYDQCTRTLLPGGLVLVVDKGYEYAAQPDGTKLWTATLTAEDGRQIAFSEWNAPAEKGVPASRPAPPLTTAQMTRLVTSGVWDRVFKAFPSTDSAPTTPPRSPAEPTKQEILTTLKQLLPAGLKVSGEGGQETGYAMLTVDDGHGRTLVEVNVQRWQPDDADFAERYAGGGTTPDGTRYTIRQEGSEKGGSGAVQWVADTFRPDGLRVVVMELNAASYGVAATRETPAIPVDRLKAIALDGAWGK
ncbi:hypothetical protein [Peterkaempfera bronchialis]|nr:hypothetical protein [Peterkaempfera bronchialis]